ncbi:MAG: hypothetical protein ACR2H3_15775 [Acidimicrobiales bacterium]
MTTFVFIHGRGEHSEDMTWWRKPVADALVSAGIAPPVPDGPGWGELRYDDLLNGKTPVEHRPLPDLPSVSLSAFEGFAATKSFLEQLVIKPPTMGLFDIADKLLSEAVGRKVPFATEGDGDALLQSLAVRVLGDVHRFATNGMLRRAIVHRLLDAMPQGDVVLIAHSLGSVAALSLLPYLPAATTIPLLITLGSPAALDELQAETLLAGTAQADFPADRVHAWLNLVNRWDPVCRGAGLRGDFQGVVDHRIGARGLNGIEVHDARTYLQDRIVGRALELTLKVDRAPARHVGADPHIPKSNLAALLTVHYARLIGEAARDAQDQRRCRKLVNEVLLPALDDSVGRRLTVAEVGFEISHWVATGRPRLERQIVLLAAALSDPFAPFEPGIDREDRRQGLRDLATWLGLEANDADDTFNLVEASLKVANNERRTPPWKLLLVGAGVVASLTIAAPIAVGAFAATGATGAAAMTSGLAGLGLGGMAGGVSAIAGVAAGIGVLGGKVSESARAAAMGDEVAMTHDLTRRAAVISLLRTADDASGAALARAGLDELDALGQALADLSNDHRKFSDSKSPAAAAVARNLARFEAVRDWLTDGEPVDGARAARHAETLKGAGRSPSS